MTEKKLELLFTENTNKLLFYLLNLSVETWVKLHQTCPIIYPSTIKKALNFSRAQFDSAFRELLYHDYIFIVLDSEVGEVFLFNSPEIWNNEFSFLNN